MTIIEFIRGVLISEIGDIVDRHKYLSFGVISQGIELLGACLDEHEFDCKKPGVSRDRFNLALKELFPANKYREFGFGADRKKFLYNNLRCGLLHNFLPKRGIGLTEENKTPAHLHLKIGTSEDGSQTYLLVAEELYRDFVDACEKLVHWIDSKMIMDRQEIKLLYSRIIQLSNKTIRKSREENELQAKIHKHVVLTQNIDFLNTNMTIKIKR